MKLFTTLSISAILALSLNAKESTPVESLQNKSDIEKSYVQSVIPNTQFTKYEKSKELEGYYKVYLDNGQMLYVSPFKNLIIFGEIWTASGQSLTQNDVKNWQEHLQNEQIKSISLEQLTQNALEMSFGNGKSKYDFVIFTDPECPFCKKAEDFFATKDVKLYINFLPLDMHPNARNMSLQILSSSDPKSTAQKIKNFETVNVEITEDAISKLSRMESLAQDLKITGTPKIFVIDNDKKKIIDVINGANIPQIEKYFN